MNKLEDADNNLQDGQIEIKVYPEIIKNIVKFYTTTQKITIDWGDGTVDDLTPNGITIGFTHTYTNDNLQTVKVNTEGMTYFYCSSHDCQTNRVYGFAFQELRFGNCPELKSIECSPQKLTILDVSKCIALTWLDCHSNNLTALDVSKCIALTDLECGSNQLTALNVSGCTNIRSLRCGENKLSTLDLSKCSDLRDSYCYSNQLTSLNVSGCTNLTLLSCFKNQLTSLDISKCTNLNTIYFSSNPLSTSAIISLLNRLPTKRQPVLFFEELRGVGTIYCYDCGYSEEITTSRHRFYKDDLTKVWCEEGVQCQSCGKFHLLTHGGKEESIKSHCDCGRKLESDIPVFCPKCKSKNVKYKCKYRLRNVLTSKHYYYYMEK